jgi:hypothetical protein
VEGVKNPRLALAVATGLIVLGLFVTAYVLTLNAFDDQRTTGPRELEEADIQGFDGLAALARVVSVNPTANEMSLRLDLFPAGRYRLRNSSLLSREVKLFVNTNKGKSVITLRRGEVVSPTEVTVLFQTGDLLDYPFDKYTAELVLVADSRAGPVPIREKIAPGFSGYKIDTRQLSPPKQPEAKIARFKLRRATSTIFFAVFVMVMFWLVSLSALGLAVSLAVKRRKWEGTFTGFLAALLFAFPAVRNALPGDPPIGSLIDYLSFFWAEGIAAVALLVAVNAWIFRQLPR